MNMTSVSFIVLGCFAVVAGVLVLAIAFGGPQQPAPMLSINNPFKTVDFSDLPAIRRFAARDGAQLAYRYYAANPDAAKGSVVIVHGSSASSNSMHPMAKAFAKDGYAAYTLDMRGHGESGTKGQIAYIGQLEDDVEDFMKSTSPSGATTLAGFSSGGGFTLRFASDARQNMFGSYLLLSPFIHQDAPTSRPGGGGWVNVGVPRLVALTVLNQAGITAFNDLPVTAFALNEEARRLLTPQYSFNLAQNFRPRDDYRADIRGARQPLEILAGQNDEAFHADRYAAVFSEAGKGVPVTIIPGAGHIDMILSPAAVHASVSAVERLQAKSGPASGTVTSRPAK